MLSSAFLLANAQGLLKEQLEYGEYAVGFKDTLAFNKSVNYKAYGYEGPYPFFVQIWYPIEKGTEGKQLTLGQLKEKELPPALGRAYVELNVGIDHSFIDYYLTESYPENKPIEFAHHSKNDVVELIREIPSYSYTSTSKIPTNRPIIVYHHGAQGYSGENVLMAEYFASKGYIFLSANFHLMCEGMNYGANDCFPPENNNTQELIRLAKKLAPDQPCYFIGHSWGAQEGWLSLYEKGLADAFVSMETTIEFNFKDTVRIKEYWSDVYKVVKEEKQEYDLPILLFANTTVDEPFHFFAGRSAQWAIHATTKEKFGHESFISDFHLRYFLDDKVEQSQFTSLLEQLRLYTEHIKMIEEFLSSIEEKREFDRTAFEEEFYINQEK